jgi:hypothetical protein
VIVSTPAAADLDPDRAVEFRAPITRMLLASDGSTTLLLQALLGQELRVEVARQERRAAGDLDRGVREAIRASGKDELLVRHSALRTAEGKIVSRNLVVADASGGTPMRRLLRDLDTPLGRGLIALGVSQSRRLLDWGLADWPQTDEDCTEDGAEGGAVAEAAAPYPCVYKAYVLVEEDVPAIYVHERYNPEFVPVER